MTGLLWWFTRTYDCRSIGLLNGGNRSATIGFKVDCQRLHMPEGVEIYIVGGHGHALGVAFPSVKEISGLTWVCSRDFDFRSIQVVPSLILNAIHIPDCCVLITLIVNLDRRIIADRFLANLCRGCKTYWVVGFCRSFLVLYTIEGLNLNQFIDTRSK